MRVNKLCSAVESGGSSASPPISEESKRLMEEDVIGVIHAATSSEEVLPPSMQIAQSAGAVLHVILQNFSGFLQLITGDLNAALKVFNNGDREEGMRRLRMLDQAVKMHQKTLGLDQNAPGDLEGGGVAIEAVPTLQKPAEQTLLTHLKAELQYQLANDLGSIENLFFVMKQHEGLPDYKEKVLEKLLQIANIAQDALELTCKVANEAKNASGITGNDLKPIDQLTPEEKALREFWQNILHDVSSHITTFIGRLNLLVSELDKKNPDEIKASVKELYDLNRQSIGGYQALTKDVSLEDSLSVAVSLEDLEANQQSDEQLLDEVNKLRVELKTELLKVETENKRLKAALTQIVEDHVPDLSNALTGVTGLSSLLLTKSDEIGNKKKLELLQEIVDAAEVSRARLKALCKAAADAVGIELVTTDVINALKKQNAGGKPHIACEEAETTRIEPPQDKP